MDVEGDGRQGYLAVDLEGEGRQGYLAVDLEVEGLTEYLMKFMMNGSHFLAG